MKIINAKLIWMVAILYGSCFADIQLPSVINDNMVLQRGRSNPIWGWTKPLAEVEVLIGNQKKKTVADCQGHWSIHLDSMDAGGPYEMVICSEQEKLFLENILIGEVWLCSGQSNMELSVSVSLNAQNEIANANYSQIRLFNVANTTAREPAKNVQGQWKICSSKSVSVFSAVGYYFGRELYKKLNVPIAIIASDWGGTPAEAWTSWEALEAAPELSKILDEYNSKTINYPESFQRYQKKLAKWKPDQGIPKPSLPYGPDHRTAPARLFNGMISPVIPYGIRGIAWYQGECNAAKPDSYKILLSCLVKDWRDRWGQGDIPFLIVQLANYKKTKGNWPSIREAQSQVAKELLNCGMAVTIDIGDLDNVHPKNKQEVGCRLGLLAQAMVYDLDVVYSGPIFQSIDFKEQYVSIRFLHADNGLYVRGQKIEGFLIAGKNKKFFCADACVEGKTVRLWSKHVKKPIAVRYGWGNGPVCNLYNIEKLPVHPFRTDNW